MPGPGTPAAENKLAAEKRIAAAGAKKPVFGKTVLAEKKGTPANARAWLRVQWPRCPTLDDVFQRCLPALPRKPRIKQRISICMRKVSGGLPAFD